MKTEVFEYFIYRYSISSRNVDVKLLNQWEMYMKKVMITRQWNCYMAQQGVSETYHVPYLNQKFEVPANRIARGKFTNQLTVETIYMKQRYNSFNEYVLTVMPIQLIQTMYCLTNYYYNSDANNKINIFIFKCRFNFLDKCCFLC